MHELADVDAGERLALDAHVDRVQRARGLVLLVEAEGVQLALERRVVLVPEVEGVAGATGAAGRGSLHTSHAA